MHNNKKNEELQSRREFFKKAAKGTLPILALTILGPSVLSSCSKDDDDDEGGDCRNGCSGSCKDSCSGGCGGGCSGGCDGSCQARCQENCDKWME